MPTGRWLLAPAALALSACASLQPVDWPRGTADRPLQVPVAFFPQERYQCGPAALAMALDATGKKLRPSDLVEQVYSPARQGSLQPAMITAARRHGRVAYPVRGLDALAAELDGGRPVIVLQNLGLDWFPQWHYAVVVGRDPTTGEVLLHSGTTPHYRMELRTFMNTWRRADAWGLVVTPPDRLPATAAPDDWLSAASGLEAASLPGDAATAYLTGLSAWPRHVPTWFALGNAFHTMEQRQRALLAWQQAVAIDPEYALAWNNLAQGLADQGRTEEALDAARRAVSLGGPYQEEFEKTLEELKAER